MHLSACTNAEPLAIVFEQAMRYTWSVMKTHAAPVSGWLSRDPIVGCDGDDEMGETILAHIFME